MCKPGIAGSSPAGGFVFFFQFFFHFLFSCSMIHGLLTMLLDQDTLFVTTRCSLALIPSDYTNINKFDTGNEEIVNKSLELSS